MAKKLEFGKPTTSKVNPEVIKQVGKALDEGYTVLTQTSDLTHAQELCEQNAHKGAYAVELDNGSIAICVEE